jgi:transcriptional regulator with XRE-family HTH domain
MERTDYRKIPNLLRRYRKSRGLRQKEVAKILGLKSGSRISKWEKGECLPNMVNLFRLSILYRTMTDAPYRDLLETLREEISARENSLDNKH